MTVIGHDSRGRLRGTGAYSLIVGGGFAALMLAGAAISVAALTGFDAIDAGHSLKEARASVAAARSGVVWTSAATMILAFGLGLLVTRTLARAHRTASRAWATLRDSEARFRLLADNAPDVIYRYSLNGTVDYVSPSVRALTGYDPEDYARDPSLAMTTLHQDDVARFELAGLAAGLGNGAPFVARWRKKCGELVWVEHHFRPVHDPHGRIVAVEGIARDVTAVRQALEARDELLAIVSHDLKNPLSAIFMTAARIEETSKLRGDETTAKLAERLKRSADRMSRLIFDLLDMASIEAGRLSIEAAPFTPSSMVVEVTEMMRPLAAAKRIDLAPILDEEAPLVCCDHDRVVQVLSNLIGNAIKFTPDRGAVRVVADRVQDGVRFSVVDTGPGVASDQVTHIFDRFWRAKPAGRSGTGLGLSIAKGIVEAHGGRIWVETEPGQGCAVRFTLPAATAAAASALATVSPPGRSFRASSRASAAVQAPTSSISP